METTTDTQQQQTDNDSTGKEQTSQPTQQQQLTIDEGTLNIINQLASDYQRQQAVNQLKSVWGERFDDTYKQVQEYLSTLPEELGSDFNTLKGALVIGELLAGVKAVPQLEGDSQVADTGTIPKNTFSRKELDDLYRNNRKEYLKLQPEIDKAYAEGRIVD